MRTDAIPVRSDHVAAMQDYGSVRERLRGPISRPSYPPVLRLVVSTSPPVEHRDIYDVPAGPPTPVYIAPISKRVLGMLHMESVFGPYIPGPYEKVAARDVITRVSAQTGVSIKDIIGPLRFKKYTRARQIAMYEVRRQCRMSLPQIGLLFHRDHTTVLYAVRKVEAQLAELQEGGE